MNDITLNYKMLRETGLRAWEAIEEARRLDSFEVDVIHAWPGGATLCGRGLGAVSYTREY